MDHSDLISKEKELIEGEVSNFFRKERVSCIDDPLARQLLASIEEYTLRDAKRVRSILVVMGYRSVGGADLEKARRAAVSLELVQTMLLIHDDIMDRSDLRRGAPSFHVEYSSMHGELGYLGEPGQFGINMALIAGDLAESLGEKALLESGFDKERIQEALLSQTQMIRDTGFGQMFDLYSVELPKWSEAMVEKVHTLKTARYTFDAPLRIGAHLHGASEQQLNALSGYALPVGVAFQIMDDILGFFGDPKRGGEIDLSDIKEGKRTLLIVKALEMVRDVERDLIVGALGNKDLTVEEARKIRRIIKASGSEEYSRRKALELTEKGLKALEGAELDPGIVSFLKAFAGYLVERV
ncbi:MAG: polyprenyl synthetase family protein [Candidatus Thermoplasmatota archaeon]|nr:polyprenyl synthetase family protein [Candidatus Thermoplasmatota archaeon]